MDPATLSDPPYRPSLRLCEVQRPAKGSCGFHLSRTQWDPYPWVSGVDAGSAAAAAGLRPGDCVLEVNGEDVLGERIGAVAQRVRAKPDRVALLLWNAGSDPQLANTVCGAAGGPTPLSLQRLSSCVASALQLLECPVCLEPAAPRALQCANGHLLCQGCRARTERCPVCRVQLGPRGRCLLADQLQALLAAACAPPPSRAAPAAAPTTAIPTSSAAPARAARRGAAALEPLVQLKSRILLPPKASSVEDVCVREGGGGGGSEAPPRARSLSAGQIPTGAAPETPAPAPDPAPDAKDPEPLLHCPRSAACVGLHPASQLLQHIREAHEGPLVQYFQRNGGGASLAIRPPPPGAPETVVVCPAAGCWLFVCTAPAASGPRGRRLLWLWALGDGAAAARHRRLSLATPPPAAPRAAPVFPLTASWTDVLASDRCVTLDGDAADSVTLEFAERPPAPQPAPAPADTAPAPTPAAPVPGRALTAVG